MPRRQPPNDLLRLAEAAQDGRLDYCVIVAVVDGEPEVVSAVSPLSLQQRLALYASLAEYETHKAAGEGGDA